MDRLRLFCFGSLLGLTICIPALAQISPGPLSRAHESLSGPLKCANCHQFGAGAPQFKCLHCHREIAERLTARRGYHARVVKTANANRDCARCHTEHYGENFNIIRWPTSKSEFNHDETGYRLLGRHASLKCEQCHAPKHILPAERKKIAVKDLNRTLLGLSTSCQTCHEDPHRGQLGNDCGRCHGFSHWKPVSKFDHMQTAFPLTGKHNGLECAKCHPTENAGPTPLTKYKGVAFASCSDCHKDPHHGAFAARCDSCHVTSGWSEVRTSRAFDHDTTKFPLKGKHAGLECSKCHKTADFKTPVAHARCLDCHQDQHNGQFVARTDGGDCGACHTETGFRPSTFTVAMHAQSKFPLQGKHHDVECAKCHKPAGKQTNYHPAWGRCDDCHRDAHNAQFAAAPLSNRCEECHTVDAFRPATFTLARHQTSSFPLHGAHAAVPCADCHRDPSTSKAELKRFRFANTTCDGCHRDPHQLAQGTMFRTVATKTRSACENCHILRSWRQLLPFDHASTGYRLTGAHQTLACVDCHRRRDDKAGGFTIAFKGAPRECVGCHEDLHGGQFARAGSETDCASCHSTTRWVNGRFDHDKSTNFALDGRACKGSVPGLPPATPDCKRTRDDGLHAGPVSL